MLSGPLGKEKCFSTERACEGRMIQLYTRPHPDFSVWVRRSFPKDRALGFRSGSPKRGAIAQLGERFNGIEEVVGSIPSGSTNHLPKIAVGAATQRLSRRL